MPKMNKTEALIEAQYQAETLSDALELFRSAELAVAAPLLPMMADRLAALVYLIQYARIGHKPENYDAILADAKQHDVT